METAGVLLDPLDLGDLRPPFLYSDPQSTSPSTSNILLDETPTTPAASLPTPNVYSRPLYAHDVYDHSMSWFPYLNTEDYCALPLPPCHSPSAPLLEDLDSFTEGTAIGSFDFSLPASPHASGGDVKATESLPWSAQLESARSIETWRNDVIMSITCDRNARDSEPRGLKRPRSSTFSAGEYDEEEHTRFLRPRPRVPHGLNAFRNEFQFTVPPREAGNDSPCCSHEKILQLQRPASTPI